MVRRQAIILCVALAGLILSAAAESGAGPDASAAATTGQQEQQQQEEPVVEVQPTHTHAPPDKVHVPYHKHRKDLPDSYHKHPRQDQPHYERDSWRHYKWGDYYKRGGDGTDGSDGGIDGPLAPEFVDPPCIRSLTAYAEAFNQGGVDRCVDREITVRVDQYFKELAQTTKNDMFANFIGARNRSVSFWSLDDNPAKYLRIGRDALQLGNFVDAPPGDVGFQNGAFPGIRDPKNFAALLEAIGYSSADTKPKLAYMLVVTKRPRNGHTAVYTPTWVNVLRYFQHYISQLAAADPQALALAGIPLSEAEQDRAFTFDASTATTFADLTGCLAQCTVQDTSYGNQSVADWTSPAKVVPRLSPTQCDVSQLSPPRYQLTEPTIIQTDAWCSAEFVRLRILFTKKTDTTTWCTRGAQDATENRALSLVLAREYLAAATPFAKALTVRAYLTTSCAGSFNSLFSGDGFTYTGNGGYLGATGNELHIGEVLTPNVPAAFPSIRLVFFCPYAQDSSPYTHAICPPEVVGTFDPEQFRAQLNAPNWDIQEVKHPSEL